MSTISNLELPTELKRRIERVAKEREEEPATLLSSAIDSLLSIEEAQIAAKDIKRRGIGAYKIKLGGNAELDFMRVLATANAGPEMPVYLDAKQPIDARIADLLGRLTLEEKDAMVHAQANFSVAGVPRLGISDLWMDDGPLGGRAEAGVFEEVKELAPPGGPRGGKKLGTLVHAMLERVDPAGLKGRDQEAWMALPATAELAGDLPKGDRKEVLRWVHQAMTRPLPLPGGGAVALCQAEEMLRELDFVTPYPGLPDFLNGSIDVLFQAGGRAHVLDWKTNQLPGYGPAALDEAVQAHYLLQVKIYSVTACRFLEIRDAEHYERAFGGVVYVFLRGLPEGGVWTCRPSWDELQAWERELVKLRPERWTGGAHHV